MPAKRHVKFSTRRTRPAAHTCWHCGNPLATASDRRLGLHQRCAEDITASRRISVEDAEQMGYLDD